MSKEQGGLRHGDAGDRRADGDPRRNVRGVAAGLGGNLRGESRGLGRADRLCVGLRFVEIGACQVAGLGVCEAAEQGFMVFPGSPAFGKASLAARALSLLGGVIARSRGSGPAPLDALT